VRREQPELNSSARRIAITGAGPLCAAGAGMDALRTRLDVAEPRPDCHDPEEEGIPSPPFPLFRVDPDALRTALPADSARGLPADPELELALGALRLAIDDAGAAPADLATAALVLTWEAPGIDRVQRGLYDELAGRHDGEKDAAETPPNRAAAFDGFYARHRDAFYHTQSFVQLHLVARALDVHGPTLFVNNACASGIYALEAAADLLRRGRAECALVAAAESPRFPTKHRWFSDLGLYADDGVMRPFDRDRNGLVFGEAGAAVVVETLDRARARGARVLAEYLGAGLNQEAWKIAVPNLTESWYEDAVRDACRNAGLTPNDIDVVALHGASTSLSDLYEARGVTSVWGERPQTPILTSLKPFFGHALGASALLEICALLPCFEGGSVPRTPGFATADPRLAIAPLTEQLELAPRTILKMANGFAGFNAGAVLRRFEGEA